MLNFLIAVLGFNVYNSDYKLARINPTNLIIIEVIPINKLKIVAIGDSITYGYPYSPDFSWVNLVAKKLQTEFFNKGINGDTTTGMLNRFKKDVLTLKPSHVIIMGGTNDAYNGTNIDLVINKIHNMVQLALENRIIPIIGLPIPCNDSSVEDLLEQYREEMHQHALQNNINFIDFHNVMVDQSRYIMEEFHCDGVHPSQLGYKTMADVAVKFFENYYFDKMIVKASNRDYQELIKVWEDSVRATHSFITEKEIQFYKPLILNEYFKYVNLFCYKDSNNKIIGYMGIADDKLEMLFIDPEHRSKGIGKKLLNFAIANQGVKKVDANEENEQAVGFYLHIGFRVINRSELDASGKSHPILAMELMH